MAVNDIELDDISQFDKDYRLQIKIVGDDYSGAVDATTAAIILDIQSKIYQIAALGIYGSEHDTRRLGPEIRRALLVKFSVNPGCTEILAQLIPAFVEVLKPVFEKMTPQDLIDLAKFLTLSFAGYKLASKLIQSHYEKIANSARDAHEKEILKQQAKALLIAAGKLGDDASQNVAKTTAGSTEVTFGHRTYSKQELDDIRERAPRTKTSSHMTTKYYIVEKIDFKKRPSIYLDLRPVPGEAFVKAQYMEDEQDAFYDDKTTATLCKAAASGDPLLLDVIEIHNEHGEVQKVTVAGVNSVEGKEA